MNMVPVSEQARLPAPIQTGLVSIEEARAAQEVQVMCTIAQRFPRDTTQCYIATMKELERFSLAKVALYSYTRGGGTVTGPSIRLVEVVARNFRNLKYGFREITRRDGVSECESFCWDMEANNSKSIPFQVRHVRDTKKGPKPVTDERDIYELVANFGTRRMRNCIQAMIPADMMEDFVSKARETVVNGDKSVPFEQRVRNILMAFDKEFSVTQEMVEKRYKHKVSDISKDEFVELFGIFNSLKDKSHTREDFFEVASEEATTPQEIDRDKAATAKEEQRMQMVAKVEERIEKYFDATGKTGDSILRIESALGCAQSQVKDQSFDRLVSMIDIIKRL